MTEKLTIVKRKLSDLKHPEINARMHPDKQIKELKRSIQKNGQTRLLVIDENNVIWIGNGLYQARIFDLGVDDMSAFDQLLKELGDDLDVPGYDEDLLRTLTADLEDVDAIASSYGLIDDDKKEELKAAKEAYEKKESELTAKGQETAPGGVTGEAQGSEPAEEETGAAGVSNRCIICPKCGETIWL